MNFIFQYMYLDYKNGPCLIFHTHWLYSTGPCAQKATKEKIMYLTFLFEILERSVSLNANILFIELFLANFEIQLPN